MIWSLSACNATGYPYKQALFFASGPPDEGSAQPIVFRRMFSSGSIVSTGGGGKHDGFLVQAVAILPFDWANRRIHIHENALLAVILILQFSHFWEL